VLALVGRRHFAAAVVSRSALPRIETGSGAGRLADGRDREANELDKTDRMRTHLRDVLRCYEVQAFSMRKD
jgi:hypothetical protein